VVAKSRIEPRDIVGLLAQARAATELPLLVVAPYLGRRSQDLLVESGASYVDATRNTRINLDPLFIFTTGATTDPGREASPLRSLRGAGAARAVRALCDYRPPVTVTALAERSETPLATLWRVVELLQREALVVVRSRKGLESVDWKGLLMRWADDYSFTTSNVARPYLEPRGVPALLAKLRKRTRGYAMTGSLAVSDLLPIVASPVAMVYVTDADAVAEELKLTAVEAGANVVLAEPLSTVVFDRVRKTDGLIAAAVSQVAVDLLTGPGRAPAEAQELIAWMQANEDAWRT
jgi:hypothetical protein